MKRSLFLFPILSWLLVSCGERQFTKGEYDDMSEERHLDDKFNETDMRNIADTMVASLAGSWVVKDAKKPPVVLITLVKNRSEEHIDMKSMTDKLRVSLVKSGKFRFTEKEVRQELQEELAYQGESGYVDPESARKKGKQIGANYFLTGEITSRVQEVGSKKYVYYKCTFNLVNIDTGILDWTDEKELRKYYQKRSVGF
ncbi:MAG: penicillin-binding protein activator LpoB [Deltaproteobacteria bacterium]|nr:penicillin-binding protein activator LpoB [Deltaproteobacteria bacterium]MBI3296399.1 penicillin-binding protein activator LpoB [Deltaproteobacteria bacterium]